MNKLATVAFVALSASGLTAAHAESSACVARADQLLKRCSDGKLPQGWNRVYPDYWDNEFARVGATAQPYLNDTIPGAAAAPAYGPPTKLLHLGPLAYFVRGVERQYGLMCRILDPEALPANTNPDDVVYLLRCLSPQWAKYRLTANFTLEGPTAHLIEASSVDPERQIDTTLTGNDLRDFIVSMVAKGEP